MTGAGGAWWGEGVGTDRVGVEQTAALRREMGGRTGRGSGLSPRENGGRAGLRVSYNLGFSPV